MICPHCGKDIDMKDIPPRKMCKTCRFFRHRGTAQSNGRCEYIILAPMPMWVDKASNSVRPRRGDDCRVYEPAGRALADPSAPLREPLTPEELNRPMTI